MAVIMKDQLAAMSDWTVKELGLPEGTKLDPKTSLGYVDANYPGEVPQFVQDHPSSYP